MFLMARMKFYSLWIGLICIAIFAIQLSISGFTELFMLTSDALSMPWQFITAIFLHGGVAHLIYNLFALIFFGLVLERLIGSNKFLIVFFLSGILANIFSFTFYPASLGASGAIMGILGCVAVIKPMMIVWAFSLPMPMFVLAIVWIIGSIMGIYGFGDSGVGHLAHLSGIIVGILFGLILRIRFKERKVRNQFVFNRRVIVPENQMRSWEDWNIR